MSPPASERAEQTMRDVRTTPYVAPQPRGADGAARHPYPCAKHIRNGFNTAAIMLTPLKQGVNEKGRTRP